MFKWKVYKDIRTSIGLVVVNAVIVIVIGVIVTIDIVVYKFVR